MPRISPARRDRVFRALADPTRRALCERLARGESPVGRLQSRFGISQSAISQHLAALKRAGLVAERREGRNAYYRLAPAGLRPLVDWIELMDRQRSFWLEKLDRLKSTLNDEEENE